MASPLRQSRVYAIEQHLKSHVLMLTEELNIFFDHAVGIAADKSYFEAVEDKLCELAEYEGALEALKRHFE